MSARAASEHIVSKPEMSWRDVLPWPALIIAIVSLLALSPMVRFGLPSGHDFEFHLDSWMEVVQQWQQGVRYPRWASGAHYGFGEARFIFYPPGSWLLGALLGLVLPWYLAPAAYCWIVLCAAGVSMFYLARQFLSRRDATFAAALYAVNPYHLVIIYWRSAFAELLASFLLPLLLLFLVRSREEGRRTIIPLALIVAAGWLANAPAAVMINYSLALIVFVLLVLWRSPRVLAYGASAVVLGAALAAFYVLPAAYEQKWVNINEVLAAGVEPQNNFLFTRMADVDHNKFNTLVSIVAVAEMAVLGFAALLARHWRKQKPGLWFTLLTWSAAAAILMLSPTAFLWEHLPKLRFVQLPWRWLLCLNVGFALFCTMGMKRWATRSAIYALMIAVLVGVWIKVQPPWWDSSADIVEMHDNIEGGAGYEGTDEYVPTAGDAYEIKKDAPEIAIEGGGRTRVNIQRWNAEEKRFEVGTSKPGKLVLHLFNYPAWSVEVNGQPVSTETQEPTGQMDIPVASGINKVQIAFTQTWDRKWGGIISGFALLVTLALAVYFDLKEPA